MNLFTFQCLCMYKWLLEKQRSQRSPWWDWNGQQETTSENKKAIGKQGDLPQTAQGWYCFARKFLVALRNCAHSCLVRLQRRSGSAQECVFEAALPSASLCFGLHHRAAAEHMNRIPFWWKWTERGTPRQYVIHSSCKRLHETRQDLL